ncbi:MAG: MGMT family protein [Pseudomonadales bacterium]|nr:MGMT family protein [Pseudomonadales bacterium]
MGPPGTVQAHQPRVTLPTTDPTPEQRIWQVVAEIPPGTVASYGQVAELAGLPGGARRVGRCLSRLPAETRLPWHRVVNATGGISLPGEAGHRQRQRLIDEGIAFEGDRVALDRCRWSV